MLRPGAGARPGDRSGRNREAGAVIERIVVPLDGSAAAEAAIPHALCVAGAFGAELVLARAPALRARPTV